ncbi:hypothetical protein GCM10023100_05100 [Actinocorallia cavernae]|uniref:Phytanoyl-CoA dioxygenase n=2 Tax=Actinomycetes TaxID=1760 RepID=A0ABN3L6Z3_9ACTN
MTATGKGTLTRAAAARFGGRGFTVVPGLFGYGEIARPCAEFAALHAAGPVPGHFAPDAADPDPLRRRPRVMHPHELSPLAREFLLDARLRSVLEALLGEEVPAAQSMFYFKPPGTRGQALHQDNFCLRGSPGTCVAARVACEPIDRGDGGLEVVPGTHRKRQPGARRGPQPQRRPVPAPLHRALRGPCGAANRGALPDAHHVRRTNAGPCGAEFAPHGPHRVRPRRAQ